MGRAQWLNDPEPAFGGGSGGRGCAVREVASPIRAAAGSDRSRPWCAWARSSGSQPERLLAGRRAVCDAVGVGHGGAEDPLGRGEHAFLGRFGVEPEHVVEGDHGLGAPGQAERLDEGGELVVGEVVAEGFDGQGVPSVALAGPGGSRCFAVAPLREPAVEAGLGGLAVSELVVGVEHRPPAPPDDRLESGLDVVARGLDGSFDGVGVDDVLHVVRGFLPELLRGGEVAVGGGDRDERPLGRLGHRRGPALAQQRGGRARQRGAGAGPLVGPSARLGAVRGCSS